MPMPDAAPVTIARLPERSMPFTTSAAVECRPNDVAIGAIMRSLRVSNVLFTAHYELPPP
ncbi:MAG: hypothetical protein V7L25_20025 [Nostoc sp.]|uniref:hypothetical protein n=1 Tax=Nostoc sp. TaxID=1180 RepID=UPI002FF381E1